MKKIRISRIFAFIGIVALVALFVFYRGEDATVSKAPVAFAAYEYPVIQLEVSDIAYNENGLTQTSLIVEGPRGIDITESFDVEIVDATLALKPKDNTVRPGKYHVEGKIETKKGIRDFSQDFYWGVLALNTNKSIYHPNEIANIDLAVLDDEGDMVCDAELTLKIQDARNKIQILSTEDGTIRVNEECKLKQVTSNPDYETEYVVGEAGVYNMNLTAITDRGEYIIEDYFEVSEDILFDIERDTATRIYPVYDYPVDMTIIPREDFKGVVVETIPSHFGLPEIHNGGLYDIDGDEKIITWNVDWKAGETYKLSYIYKSPEISPQFYLIGPLELFDKGGSSVFTEVRQWQIAVDAIAHDASSNSGLKQSVSSFNWSHTVTSSGSGHLLFVGVGMIDSSLGDRTVNSVTYNGTSMTKIREDDDSSGSISTSIFYLTNPDTGSNTVQVNLAGVNNGVAAGAISLTGVDPDNALDANTGQVYTGATLSTDITTVADNAYALDTYAHTSISTDPSIGSGQSLGWNIASPISNDNTGGSYEGPKTPAGAVTMSWSTGNGGSDWTHSVASFKPLNAPTISSVTDTPDPVDTGGDLSFSVDWNDDDVGELVKVKICKTDALSAQNCTGGFWASSTVFAAADPRVEIYQAQEADIGSNNYYAFVCDDGASCSASTSGTFSVDDITLDSAYDTPDPTNPNRSVSWIVDWSSGASTVKLKVCKTSTLTAQNCPGGFWASSSAFSSRDPAIVSYDVVGGDAGQTRNYWVFVCDDSGTCTTSSSGSFTVNTESTVPNIDIRGGLIIR